MKLRKPAKVFLAIVTVVPIIYMFCFFAFIIYMMATTFSADAPNKEVFDFFPIIFIVHFAVILLGFVLIAFYMFYLFKTDRVAQDKKTLWAVALFLGSFISMPIFWYLYVWKEPVTAYPAGEQLAAPDASSGSR